MKNRRIYRSIAIILTAAVIVSCLKPVSIYAAEPDSNEGIEDIDEETIEETVTETDSVEALAAAIERNQPKQLNAKIKRTSGDYASGYYVVYEVNGHEYRSDRMGTKYNKQVWDELSEADRRKLLKNYAFAPKEMQNQFGEDNTAKMLEWYEGVSGLTEARKILSDRIAQKNFPKLEYFYREDYETRSYVELPETKYDIQRYRFLPEVKEYLALDKKMRSCYDTGRSSYRVLIQAKTGQISTAIKGLSAVMIKQLICDRVLVPAISPGGLSALVPEIKGELWNLYDNITGYTGDIYTICGLGDWPDGTSARKIIDKYWEVINYNERYTNICVDTFLTFKGRKLTMYNDAIDAIEWFVKDNGRLDEEKTKEIEKDTKDIAPTAPQTSEEPLDGESEAERRTRVLKELEKERKDLYDQYKVWNNAVYNDAQEKYSKLFDIYSGYSTFKSETCDSRARYCINARDFTAILNIEDYPARTALVPAAIDEAISQVDEWESKLDAYIEEYNNAMEKYTAEWTEYEGKFNGLNDKIVEYNGRREEYLHDYNNEEGKDVTRLTLFYDKCGVYSVSGGLDEDIPVSFDQIKSLMEDRKNELTQMKEQFKNQLDGFESKMTIAANEYAEAQKLEEEATKEYNEAKETADSVRAEADELYFYTDGEYESLVQELHSEELETEYRTLLDAGDGEGLAALCDGWGSDLEKKLDTWQTATAIQNEARNNLMRSKHRVEATLRTLTSTSSDFDKYVDFLSGIGGTELRYYKEIAPSYGPGSSTSYAASSPVEMSKSLFYSYKQFGDSNEMALEHDIYYQNLLSQKPNYMRGNVSQQKLLSPYTDGDSALRKEPDVIPLYGSYYTKYKYTSPLWVGLLGMTGVKSKAKSLELFDANKAGSWAWERKHGYVPVTGIEYADGDTGVSGLVMEPGEIKDLNYLIKVLPLDASDKFLFWESDNIDVISVDGNGVGTATGEGTATLTVRARDSAWVENEDGTITYTPAPLTVTVKVGEATHSEPVWITDSTWNNYGTADDPKLFRANMIDDNTAIVTCSVSSITSSEAHIVVALYNDEGQMLDSQILPYTYEPGFRYATLTADITGGLSIKAFALCADDTLAPLDGELLINEKIR